MGLLCAEQNVGKQYTIRISGTPVRRTKRQKYQTMNVQELWDSYAQNKTSEISNSELSRIMGLLCAEQNVGNLKKMHFRISGTTVRRTKRRKYQKMYFHEFWDVGAQNKTSELSKMHFQ